jgi:hypothetical protein
MQEVTPRRHEMKRRLYRGNPSVPELKRPGRKAAPAQFVAYRQACKKRPTSQSAPQKIKTIRTEFDLAGAGDKTLLIALDGSFCNCLLLGQELDRMELLCRCRKDARLSFLALQGVDDFTLRKLSVLSQCAKMRGELGKKQKFTIAAPGEQCVLKKSLPFIGAKALSAVRCVYWSLLRRLTAITNWERLSIASQPISSRSI